MELPDEVLRYFEFIPKEQLSDIFTYLLADSVKERVTGSYFNRIFSGNEVLPNISLVLGNTVLSVQEQRAVIISDNKAEAQEIPDEPATYAEPRPAPALVNETDDDDLFEDMFK